MSLWKLTRRSWLLSTAAAFLLPKWARATVRKHGASFNTGAVIPSGVAFQAIDGGPNFYSSISAGAGTNIAAQSRTFNGVTYAGWDDPRFFSIGPFLAPFNFSPSAEVARWQSIGLNTAFMNGGPNLGQLDLYKNNGISLIAGYQYLGETIANDRLPGNETVGIYTYDEPQRLEQAIQVCVIGNPAGTFTGSSVDSGAATLTIGGQSGGAAFWAFGTSYSLPILTGTGIVGSGTTAQISSYGTGTGGAGTYGLANQVSVPSSSLTIGSPPYTTASFTVSPASSAPQVGGAVHMFNSNATLRINGTINTYNSGTGAMTVNATSVSGSGTDTVWTVQLDVPSETITQAAVSPLATGIQNLRFMFLGHPTVAILRFPTLTGLSGTVAIGTIWGTNWLAPDGVTQRHVDGVAGDYYAFIAAFQSGGSKQLSDTYDISGGTPALPSAQVAKGTHYGNFIDYFRKLQTVNSFPIGIFLDNSNSNSGIAYDTQPVECNWSAWSSIIHGCRQISWFNNCDGISPSGCNGFFQGGDNFSCTFMQTAGTATFTGTISAGVLTTTGAVTGTICPGMVSTAGTSGQVVILQQTSNQYASPGSGVGTTFAVATVSGAGTVTGTMTFTQTNIGFGGAGGPSVPNTFSNKGMRDGITQTNTLIRTMAPVINSPFAVCNIGQTLGPGQGYVISTSPTAAYIFPSNTGVKNSFPPQSLAFGQAGSTGALVASAIDCCAKYYTGGTYIASTGDSITNGFYIFATTRFEENHTPNISVTFTINDPFATSIRVIGENRTINFSLGQGSNAASFIDTFDFAWTVRIYKVNH